MNDTHEYESWRAVNPVAVSQNPSQEAAVPSDFALKCASMSAPSNICISADIRRNSKIE